MSEQYKATPEEWATIEELGRDNFYAPSCRQQRLRILELRARVEALEGKYETMRLATLEWGEDVDKLKRWSDQHLQRIMALEANSKPTPNPSQIRSSLVERLRKARHAAAVLGDDQDRAALCEVAAWLVEKYSDTDECLESLIGVVVGEIQVEAGR